MVVSDEHRPLDCSLPHELTSKTPFPGLKLCFLIGILSFSALSIALLICLWIRLSRTSKKRGTIAKETNLQASSRHSYDVFLSFRGLDTRHGFTDCLYHAMVDAGIHIFRDDESLCVGERISNELLQAIENSKIYIPIFSKNYAASHWCLQELAHMVDCTSKSNEYKKILPIFLDVEPDDVKLKTKLYNKALSKHRRKFCTEAIESWKNALIEVDEIKGWNLKKDHGQGELIRSVIQTVSVMLKVAYQNVTEHLVGVDDGVEAIIQKLDVGSDGVRFLGIHGMGGVGKTTLAKVVFNKLSSTFDQCCFLANVRELSKGKDGLVNLQKTLLSKLLGHHSIDLIFDVNDGINKIRGALGNKHVLIILDDVDEKEQLESLVGNGSWFGSCSRIIVTTRDKSVLPKDPNVSTYEVCEMEFDHALKLFSRRAFNSDSPPNHRVSLSKKIVDTLGRLPLALEIIGSSLLGEPEELWMDTWKKLQKAPHKDVQKKLMITYEKLGDGEKEIFLDIACLFVNEDKTYPFYMWDDCGYHPHSAIRALLHMSLIKIKDDKTFRMHDFWMHDQVQDLDKTFWMHDQVRDLGREIVRQENSKHPSERSRVWKQDEGLSILRQKERSCKVEALSLGAHGVLCFREEEILTWDECFCEEEILTRDERFREEEILTQDEFAYLQNLRFFEGRSVSLVGDFKNLLPNLRWLSWQGNSFETANFHPANLVVLNLSRSYISEEWIGWDQIREARKLKVLDLSYCGYLTRTPNLSTWVYLERLVLEGCDNIIEIDHSIGKLKLLIVLNLYGCESLQELPEEIGCLQALTHFIMPTYEGEFQLPMISKRPFLKLPYSIGGLVKLMQLNLSGCEYIEELLDTIGKLQSLVELDLSSTSIGRLPDSIGNLKQLKVLRVRQIRGITELPRAIWLLEKLEELNARGCQDLTGEIPKEIGRLSRLRILNLSHTRISRLPTTVSHLSNLQTLELEDCLELKQLPELPPSLHFLAWDHKCRRCLRKGTPSQQETPVITLSTNIGSLSWLKKLQLCCENVQFLPKLPSSLRQLHLYHLATTQSPDFSNLKDLSSLTFNKCSLELSRIFDAESEYLYIGFSDFRDYRKLRVYKPLQLEMKRLRTLEMVYCEFLLELDLSRMKNLEMVDLSYCKPLLKIRGLEELGSLCSLSVQFCNLLERMSDLSKLKKLPKLQVFGCDKLNREEIYRNYWNGEFGGDICNVGGFDLSSVPDECKVDAFFHWESWRVWGHKQGRRL